MKRAGEMKRTGVTILSLHMPALPQHPLTNSVSISLKIIIIIIIVNTIKINNTMDPYIGLKRYSLLLSISCSANWK